MNTRARGDEFGIPINLSEARQDRINSLVVELQVAERLHSEFHRLEGHEGPMSMEAGRSYHRIRTKLTDLLMERL